MNMSYDHEQALNVSCGCVAPKPACQAGVFQHLLSSSIVSQLEATPWRYTQFNSARAVLFATNFRSNSVGPPLLSLCSVAQSFPLFNAVTAKL